MRFSVVIPAWNEARTIERAVGETRTALEAFGSPWEVIVVDDGSTDDTSQIVHRLVAEDERVRLLRHEVNQGKGAAVKTGALAAHGEWIIFLDADLSVHPSEIARLASAMDGAEVVIGSRRVAHANIAEAQPMHRDYAGRVFNMVMRLITGLPYHDTQCGFKAFHQKTKPLFERLESTGWAFDVELLARARQASFRIVEVPVTWRHGRESRVKWKDAVAILGELIQISATSRLS